MSCVEKPGGFAGHVVVTTQSGKKYEGYASEVVAVRKTWLMVRCRVHGPTLVNPGLIASIREVESVTKIPPQRTAPVYPRLATCGVGGL